MKIQQKLAIGFVRSKITAMNFFHNRKAAKEAFRIFCTPLGNFSSRVSPDFLNAEPLQFSMNGKVVRGYRCNPGKMNKILLLHGFSSNCQNFGHYVQPLINKNYEVLAFDAPAHGASDGVTINAIEYSQMIIRIIELYGPVHGFIAHSFGGLAVCLALETLPTNPDTKLVLLAAATETTTAIDIAFSIIGLKNKLLRKTFDDIIFETSGREPSWYSIRRALNNIKAKVLWIHDKDDDITPFADVLQVQKDHHPNVRFIITEQLGHRKIYRDAGVINEVINFF